MWIWKEIPPQLQLQHIKFYYRLAMMNTGVLQKEINLKLQETMGSILHFSVVMKCIGKPDGKTVQEPWFVIKKVRWVKMFAIQNATH